MISLYRAELNAGLSQPAQFDVLREEVAAKAAITEDAVVHYLTAIAARSGWTSRDDVIDRIELWSARSSTIFKPIRLESDKSQIVGSVVEMEVIADDGTVVDTSTVVEDLPKNINLRTGAVVWRFWEDTTMQKAIDHALAQELSLQVEYRFSTFDYAILEADGVTRVIPRNKDSASLSAHLKAFGGDGLWKGKRIGRLLRGLTVTGETLISRPRQPAATLQSSVAKCVGLITGVPATSESLAEQITRCFS